MSQTYSMKNSKSIESPLIKFKPSISLFSYIIFWICAGVYVLGYKPDHLAVLKSLTKKPARYFLLHNWLIFSITAVLIIGLNYIFPFAIPLLSIALYFIIMYSVVLKLLANPNLIMTIFSVLTFLVIALAIFLIFKYLAQITSIIKRSSALMFNNLTVIVLSILIGAALVMFQTFCIISFFINLDIVKDDSHVKIRYIIYFFFAVLSYLIVSSFLIVFISSVIYNSENKTNLSVFGSFVNALSAFLAILKFAFLLSFLRTIREALKILYEEEARKEPKKRNSILMLLYIILLFIVDIIAVVFEHVSYLTLVYIGVHNEGGFNAETMAKANKIRLFDEYIVFSQSGFEYLILFFFAIIYSSIIYAANKFFDIFKLWDIKVINLSGSNSSFDRIVFFNASIFLPMLFFINLSILFVNCYQISNVSYMFSRWQKSMPKN